jgi:hypothetical protein
MDGCPAMMNFEVTVHGLVSPRFGSEQISLLMRVLHRAHGKCKTVLTTHLSGLGAGEPLLRDSVAGRRLCMKSVHNAPHLGAPPAFAGQIQVQANHVYSFKQSSTGLTLPRCHAYITP